MIFQRVFPTATVGFPRLVNSTAQNVREIGNKFLYLEMNSGCRSHPKLNRFFFEPWEHKPCKIWRSLTSIVFLCVKLHQNLGMLKGPDILGPVFTPDPGNKNSRNQSRNLGLVISNCCASHQICRPAGQVDLQHVCSVRFYTVQITHYHLQPSVCCPLPSLVVPLSVWVYPKPGIPNPGN